MTAGEARRERQREATRRQIIDAARRIVVGEGYRSLTMRRIAEAVEYSPAAIYQYFENRDAIAIAVSAEGFEQLVAAFEPAQTIEDPRERLEALGRAYVRFGLEHPETYRLMFMEDWEITNAVLRDPQPDDPGTRAYAALLAPIAQLHAAGALAAGDAGVGAIADAFVVAMHGIVSLKLTCPAFPPTPVEPLLETTLRALLDGVMRPSAQP